MPKQISSKLSRLINSWNVSTGSSWAGHPIVKSHHSTGMVSKCTWTQPQVLQFCPLLDPNSDQESRKNWKSDSGSVSEPGIITSNIITPLFKGSKSGSGITKKLKRRLRIRIHGLNHNTSSPYLDGLVVVPVHVAHEKVVDGHVHDVEQPPALVVRPYL